MSFPTCRHNPYADPLSLAGSWASAACDECMAEFATHVRLVFDQLLVAHDTPGDDSLRSG